jgi:hypothetical protein
MKKGLLSYKEKGDRNLSINKLVRRWKLLVQ